MQAQDAFKNFTVAKITLPVSEDGTTELDCVVHMIDAQRFEATFLPNQLPVGTLSMMRAAKVYYYSDGQGHLINCQIVEVVNSEKLLLEIKKNKTFNRVREYFRVNAYGRVEYQDLSGKDDNVYEAYGLINISGGGARFPVDHSFSIAQKIKVSFYFDDPIEIEVHCVVEVVRSRNFQQNKFVAVRFIEIESRAREQVISLCMAIQREDIRTKVDVPDA